MTEYFLEKLNMLYLKLTVKISFKYEIKKFKITRLEKALLQPVTRASTGKLPANRINVEHPLQNRVGSVNKTSVNISPLLVNSKQIGIGQKASAEEIKEKMEQELRLQRAEHHKKRTLEMMQQKKGNFGYILKYSLAK